MEYKIKYGVACVAQTIARMQQQVYDCLEQAADAVCVVLTDGGIFFSSKLLFDCMMPLDIRYLKVSSYHGKEQGSICINDAALGSVEGKTVFVFDDICDSGSTVNAVNALLKEKKAAAVKYVTLIKRAGAVLDADVDLLYGISDDSTDFFVGCGLDDNGKGRNLPYIGVID
ncbi:MAG: hypothetical protein NC038_07865 [Paludibacter sp.]|nr:hypothetical protein [Bacteroidales bacterium]MCM1069254.1 hypothetical protein [Prevotella sp.]MCM1353763.1 hypothetical protein [Bacteroides sp.]MCM1442169.1 hypothetical protein [Muribaculum sp.]MCM1482534.1 hypothetical protein [Paludibacter sp.]